MGIGLNATAEEVGIDPGYLSKIEKGTRVPTIEILNTLAGLLNISRFKLLTEAQRLSVDRNRITEAELKLFKNTVDAGLIVFRSHN